ncbi:DUF1236 domain-containing protein [Jiella sp. MQZ9-1]|uniref:DUF2845 domain-containing protein n=1 Tax=Jiella flava TaxID=2816857 RepID=A0A939JSR5_9HYPH|nr:hypothetical protein [Jiella flava]MBO0661370.1 hypothetical protein [Jiella flava]MCD2470015.1 DUF1236 domain-containing protein [Jiella flava]
MLKRTIAVAALFALQLAVFTPAQAADDRVNVLQYALAHPTDNSRLPNPPALGDSVPGSVKLERPNGSHAFAYFYWGGQPVIVDLKTRSIVRIGGG